MADYLFGYGSLINSESRAKTGQTGEGIPARVYGFQRAWNKAVNWMRMSATGVIQSEGAACNGVISLIPDGELDAFDGREQGYSRLPIPQEHVLLLDASSRHDGTTWIYVTNQPQMPSDQTPIVQSYLDVIIVGCFSFGEAFVREFIRSTQGWDRPWQNDRDNPRYSRSMPRDPALEAKIDQFLMEELGQLFGRRT
jgi:cation transport regulator ChaC